MSWRHFKKQSDGIKVVKVVKGGFPTLNTLIPCGEDLKKTTKSQKQYQNIAHKMINRSLSELDQAGRPWPLDFLARLTPDEREHLRQMEKNIDIAVRDGNEAKLTELLTGWRKFLLGIYH